MESEQLNEIMQSMDQSDMPIEVDDEFENYRKTIVSQVGYMLGIGESILRNETQFQPDIYDMMAVSQEATIIRHLSILRVMFLRNYDKIVKERTTSFKLLEQMTDLLSEESIMYLRSKSIEVTYVGTKGNNNITINIGIINQYIRDYIDQTKKLFPEWVKYEYIKNLFLMPDGEVGHNNEKIKTQQQQENLIIKIHQQRKIYLDQRTLCPFQQYINWPTPLKESKGNVLYNDAKFLKLLYAANHDMFAATEYVIDAKTNDKESIYDFVGEARNVAIFVDCENVNAYAFASTILNLEPENIAKIKKIVLYDDVNTSTAWDNLSKIMHLPVERQEIPRLLENKSLVDVTMTAGVCKEHYMNNVESIILASSDSDFWGLISQLPAARFFVLQEHGKTSYAVLQKLDERGIKHCYMDDFAQDRVQQFKNDVLFANLMERINGFNASGQFAILDIDQLIQTLFNEAGISGQSSQIAKEKEEFYKKYLRAGFVIVPKDTENGKVFKMELNRK